MFKTFIFGLISSSGYLLGAYVGLRYNFRKATMASIMSFGSGVLIATLSVVLMEESYRNGGFHVVSLGFLIGGAAFIVLDYVIDIMGGAHRHHYKSLRAKALANDKAIALGALLDGIPEALVIGIGVSHGRGLGLMMLLATILNNVPEGISGVHGLGGAYKSRKFMFRLWAAITVVCSLAAVYGYLAFKDASPEAVSFALAIASGSILAMVSETLIPEAYHDGGRPVTFFLLIGFLVTFELSHLVV